MRVTVDMQLERVQRALRAAAKKGLNPKEIWEEIGIELEKSIDQNFKEEGRPEKWKPLTPKYLQKKGGGYKILTKSSRLRRSIVSKADAQGVTIGSNVDYAAIHNFGGTPEMKPGPAAIPAREFAVLQDDDYEKMAEIIESELVTWDG